ncbi:aminoglycoside phosphotransferase family protein [Streptomyces drozdowiczii]|uniref:Aminoglycoside phosphotransferase family protein n=1 Tax=Streptomyces drozdowiczii TaxID=202862 RepID=A0ABY6PYM3_9ACTN|nr:aminoglycoside phosphotransferase family protein [Streptomyces drozdowiczii]MCX0242912.1 aminoglycoside phosphotransferase family protein [Streptomyces drozdowiczii]UZK57089.1 aminoglycoside phosphotransferase family protein [Streptomyces drozdowiczii]
MTATAPPAQGVRHPWSGLPAPVRAAVEDILGAPVTEARSQSGGFSPGVAARLRLANGGRAFVKAVSAEVNADSPDLHRAEARVTASLPAHAPVPRLLGSYDDGTCVALVLEDIDGRQPRVPWDRTELDRVLAAVGDLARILTPAPAEVPAVAGLKARMFTGWRTLHAAGGDARLHPWAAGRLAALAELESRWAEAAAGDTLAHGDLRADNILLTRDRTVFVDWPHAVRAAPWFDLLVMLPCVAAQGGPDPDALFTAHPLGRDADPDAVTAVLAAVAGYFAEHALRPDPPGLPTLRAFQAAQGAAALTWLRQRF